MCGTAIKADGSSLLLLLLLDSVHIGVLCFRLHEARGRLNHSALSPRRFQNALDARQLPRRHGIAGLGDVLEIGPRRGKIFKGVIHQRLSRSTVDAHEQLLGVGCS
jgi:hypothetical protein